MGFADNDQPNRHPGHRQSLDLSKNTQQKIARGTCACPSSRSTPKSAVELRSTHIGRHVVREEIITRRSKDVYDLGILWEETFVLGIAGSALGVSAATAGFLV